MRLLSGDKKYMHSSDDSMPSIWRVPVWAWIYFIVLAALAGFAFYRPIREMIHIWEVREEYSYGYLIPFITAFLVWQKRDSLEKTPYTGSWVGIGIICLGAILFVLGTLTAFILAAQYAMLMVIIGSAFSIMGWKALRPVLVPLLFLAFMLPLPGFFLLNLSAQLQLISSVIGVDVIRLFGISVYLEGNVIDLGSMKLQVVEACSGLRYLFPLMSLSFICAYIFKGAFWKKAIIFLSSIPITILMNSFRIGMIGILVEYWGKSQAEGFLHDFEGWVIFMACLSVILAEIWLLARTGSQKQSFKDAFNLELPAPSPAGAEMRERNLPKQHMAVSAMLVVIAASSVFLTSRADIHPPRKEFASFPMTFSEWQGKREFLEKMYLDILRLDDYLLADYTRSNGYPVNLYVAYYASQKMGEAAHSPRTCIPGGGWQIKSMTPHTIEGAARDGGPLAVNRLVIQKGEGKQLVYYWFQQRGRVITNEYAVKWYLLKDTVTRSRTDGSLVRLTTILKPGEDISEGDRRLASFAKLAIPELHAYIPE